MNSPKELEALLVKSSFVSTVRRCPVKEKHLFPENTVLIGGIYDGLDNPLTNSQLKRAWGTIQAHDPSYVINRSATKKISKKAIYGGIILGHYGHFLLESLARVWYLINTNDEDVYFYCFQGIKKFNCFDDLNVWQKEILSHLIPNSSRIHLITEPLVFDELVVPDAGYVIRQYCSTLHAQALSVLGTKIAKNCPKDSLADKVWLSRSSLVQGAIAGEQNFEAALSKEGFLIAHPEKLPLSEQIMLFNNASVIAGFTGSAFHTLLFAQNKGAKLLHFSRMPKLNENYLICAEAAGFQAEYYNFFVRFSPLRKGNANVVQDLSALWQLLYTKGLVTTQNYSDLTIEDDLARLDEEHKKIRPNLFRE